MFRLRFLAEGFHYFEGLLNGLGTYLYWATIWLLWAYLGVITYYRTAGSLKVPWKNFQFQSLNYSSISCTSMGWNKIPCRVMYSRADSFAGCLVTSLNMKTALTDHPTILHEFGNCCGRNAGIAFLGSLILHHIPLPKGSM